MLQTARKVSTILPLQHKTTKTIIAILRLKATTMLRIMVAQIEAVKSAKSNSDKETWSKNSKSWWEHLRVESHYLQRINLFSRYIWQIKWREGERHQNPLFTVASKVILSVIMTLHLSKVKIWRSSLSNKAIIQIISYEQQHSRIIWTATRHLASKHLLLPRLQLCLS